MKKIFLILGIGIAVGIILLIPIIVKVRIECKSQYGDCPKEISDKIDVYNGKNLLSAKRSVKKVLESELLVSDFSLQYKIPDILNVQLLVKKPIVAFRNTNSGDMVLVDQKGTVLMPVRDSVLPKININEALPKEGTVVGATYFSALNIATGVFQMYQVSESLVQGGTLLVELPGQIRVIFPLDGDFQVLLGSLRLIYSKIQTDGNTLRYTQIDLRFRNPVLR